jgi:hypothetical protein
MNGKKITQSSIALPGRMMDPYADVNESWQIGGG